MSQAPCKNEQKNQPNLLSVLLQSLSLLLCLSIGRGSP